MFCKGQQLMLSQDFCPPEQFVPRLLTCADGNENDNTEVSWQDRIKLLKCDTKVTGLYNCQYGKGLCKTVCGCQDKCSAMVAHLCVHAGLSAV